MIYWLGLIFLNLYYLPVFNFNWHTRIWYWAADNAIYLYDGWVRLDGAALYYWTMILLYLVWVVLPGVLTTVVPLLAYLVGSLVPLSGFRSICIDCAYLSLDAIQWVRGPYTFRNDNLRSLENFVLLVGVGLVLWQGAIAPFFNTVMMVSLFLAPGTSFLAIGLILTVWLGRLETRFFWTINAALRRAATREY